MKPWMAKLMKGYSGITLWPFGIYIQPSLMESPYGLGVIKPHEATHWLQQREMLGIFFYLWYGVEWLIRVPIDGYRMAYDHVSFEIEAYLNESNITYNQTRKHYAWLKYVV